MLNFKTYTTVPKTINAIPVNVTNIQEITDWLNEFCEGEYLCGGGMIWTYEDGSMMITARYGEFLTLEGNDVVFHHPSFLEGYVEVS